MGPIRLTDGQKTRLRLAVLDLIVQRGPQRMVTLLDKVGERVDFPVSRYALRRSVEALILTDRLIPMCRGRTLVYEINRRDDLRHG